MNICGSHIEFINFRFFTESNFHRILPKNKKNENVSFNNFSKNEKNLLENYHPTEKESNVVNTILEKKFDFIKNVDLNDENIENNLLFKKIKNTLISSSKSNLFENMKNEKKYYKLNFSTYDHLRIVCIRLCNSKKRINNEDFNKKFQFYQEGEKKTNSYFDLIFIIKKFEEIEVIKILLFQDYQREIINYLSKPILNLNKTKNLGINLNENHKIISRSNIMNDNKDKINQDCLVYKDDQIKIETYLSKFNEENPIDQNILVCLKNQI